MCSRVALLALSFGVAGLIHVETARAAQIFSDSFETYTAAGSPLDKNTAGPNAAPNGSGNPWFGPAPPNARVVNTEGGVLPFTGTNMIRGSAPSDFDENWVNLAYRFNGGTPFAGGLAMNFRFYDPLGSGATANTYRDFAGVGYYDTAPGNTDYPGTGSLNAGVVNIQRLVLGASSDTGGTYDPTKYQVRVVGRTDGYNGGSGWFNTPVSRTVGWHLGRIVIGDALPDGTNPVDFYIDNTATPAFSSNSVTNFGYNVIELNTNYGTTAGYMDDVVLSTSAIPEPATGMFAASAGLLVLRRRRR